MDERAHLVDREALGTRRQAEQLEGEVAVVHAAGAQVVAPDRDLAEIDRHLQLRVDVAQRARRVVGLGVVHHHAEGAIGHAARAVLDLPLRVDPARLAVGVDDAIALRVAAGAARRFGIGHARAVVGMDALDRVAVVRRAVRRIEAPEVEHVLVPATLAGRDVALPDAEPAELLRRVEQLVLAGARVPASACASRRRGSRGSRPRAWSNARRPRARRRRAAQLR